MSKTTTTTTTITGGGIGEYAPFFALQQTNRQRITTGALVHQKIKNGYGRGLPVTHESQSIVYTAGRGRETAIPPADAMTKYVVTGFLFEDAASRQETLPLGVN